MEFYLVFPLLAHGKCCSNCRLDTERSSVCSALTPLERRGKAATGGFYPFLGDALCPAPAELVAL